MIRNNARTTRIRPGRTPECPYRRLVLFVLQGWSRFLIYTILVMIFSSTYIVINIVRINESLHRRYDSRVNGSLETRNFPTEISHVLLNNHHRFIHHEQLFPKHRAVIMYGQIRFIAPRPEIKFLNYNFTKEK